MTNLDFIKPSGKVGVEVHGIDLSKGVSGSDFKKMKEAFIKNGLIFFRDQNLSPEQHINFAQQWGEININRFFAKVDGFEKIAEVKKEPDQKINIGEICKI